MRLALHVFLLLLLPACCAKKTTTATDARTTSATVATTHSRSNAVETIKTAARFRADSVVVRVISDTLTKTVTIYRPHYITVTADSASAITETATTTATETTAKTRVKTTSSPASPWWAITGLIAAGALLYYIIQKLIFG